MDSIHYTRAFAATSAAGASSASGALSASLQPPSAFVSPTANDSVNHKLDLNQKENSMPAKTRKPAAVLNRGELESAKRLANAAASNHLPGFAGRQFDNPSPALAALVRALHTGDMGPPEMFEPVIVRASDNRIVAVISRSSHEFVAHLSERRRLLLPLLAAGWNITDDSYRLTKARTESINEVQAAFKVVLAHNEAPKPAQPAVTDVDLNEII